MNQMVKPQPDFSLADKFDVIDGRIYLTGIQALIRVLIEQRRADARRGLSTSGFVCGYPGSPLGGFDLEMERHKRLFGEHDIVHRYGLNEDLAATAAFGTQMLHGVPGAKRDGVFAMWFGKAPGIDRTGDAFRHANIRGVGRNGGVLAVAGDDPHATSSMIPSDSNQAFYDFQMSLLAPGDIQDVIDFGLHGYALSRACGLWTGFKFVTSIADAAGTVQVAPNRIPNVIPQIEMDGRPFIPFIRLNEAGPPMREAERDLFYGRIELARRYAALNGLNQVRVNTSDAWLGIVTSGKTYFDVRQALRNLGLDDTGLERLGIRILKMGMIHPVEPQIIRDFARGLKTLVVIEEKRPFLEMFIKDILYGTPDAPRVLGKMDAEGNPLFRAFDDLNQTVIAQSLGGILHAATGNEQIHAKLDQLKPQATPNIAPITQRGAYFCSGCPHNSSMPTPAGSITGAGIGCHVMALYMGRERFGNVIGYTQMGGEGAQWVGLAPFTETDHFFQNLGDGTFVHSGSLAVRFAVSAGTNVTYKLLYNQAVAMVGGQPVTGALSVPALTRLLEAEGVAAIVVTTDDMERYRGVALAPRTTVRSRNEMLAVENELRKIKGVTVLIHDQQCAAEKRRLRKRDKLVTPERVVVINERVCEGCGDCGRKSNCLSVQPTETEFGRKTQIHQSSCNQDFSCLKGDCPSFMTIEISPKKLKANRKPVPLPDVLLPPPREAAMDRSFGIFMTGIGGTGVVTVNQILATAATIDGWIVRGMDVTGVSQKAGPVVSELRLISREGDYASALSVGEADLLLAFDEIVAVNPENLTKIKSGHSVAVVSTSKVPTGRMVAHIKDAYPALAELRARIDGVTSPKRNIYIDAQKLAETFVGDHLAGNMVVLGAACQSGLVPITFAAIERAVEMNGAGAANNLKALQLGRIAAAYPEALDAGLVRHSSPAKTVEQPVSNAAAAAVAELGGSPALRRLVEIRYDELIAYQDVSYARSYVRAVKVVAERERMTVLGEEAVTTAFARNLYKVMAYKDEFEVARLLLQDVPAADQIKGAKFYWHLHPTFARALGFKDKLKLGPWFKPALWALARLKGLRGTGFDLLGHTYVRRAERKLIGDYRAMMLEAIGSLTPARHDAMVALAESPDAVRGYESVKVRNIDRYYRNTARLLTELGETPKATRLPRKASAQTRTAIG